MRQEQDLKEKQENVKKEPRTGKQEGEGAKEEVQSRRIHRNVKVKEVKKQNSACLKEY